MPQKKPDIEARKILFILEVPKDAPEGTVGETIEFDLAKVPEDLLPRLALHGASQKIGDSYSGAKESGEDPIAYAKASIEETIKQLYEGKWSVGRTGTGAPRTTHLVRAYAALTGKTLEEALETVGGLTDEEKKALQGQKKIAAKIAQFKAEDAAARAAKLAEEAAKEDAASAA